MIHEVDLFINTTIRNCVDFDNRLCILIIRLAIIVQLVHYGLAKVKKYTGDRLVKIEQQATEVTFAFLLTMASVLSYQLQRASPKETIVEISRSY